MIIHGDKDEVVPVADVEKLNQKLSSQKNITIDYQVVKGANHFFTDHMEPLISRVGAYLDKARKQAA